MLTRQLNSPNRQKMVKRAGVTSEKKRRLHRQSPFFLL